MRASKIETLVHSMMITSTGTSFLDSGGDDGRAWQRNRRDYPTVEDIRKEEYVTLDVYDYTTDTDGAVPTVEVWHYLTSVLELDGICEDFNALPCEYWDSEEAYGVSVAQVEWLKARGLTIKDTWNSYNGESNLSQTLQGANVARDGDALEYPSYILLQLHNGADVRGGYTDAKLFKVACEYFTTNPDVYGTIDGVEVSTSYNGYDLRDDNGNVVPLTPESVIRLEVSQH